MWQLRLRWLRVILPAALLLLPGVATTQSVDRGDNPRWMVIGDMSSRATLDGARRSFTANGFSLAGPSAAGQPQDGAHRSLPALTMQYSIGPFAFEVGSELASAALADTATSFTSSGTLRTTGHTHYFASIRAVTDREAHLLVSYRIGAFGLGGGVTAISSSFRGTLARLDTGCLVGVSCQVTTGAMTTDNSSAVLYLPTASFSMQLHLWDRFFFHGAISYRFNLNQKQTLTSPAIPVTVAHAPSVLALGIGVGF